MNLRFNYEDEVTVKNGGLQNEANVKNGLSEPQAVVIMGVTGSGKSTVGQMLADKLGWTYYDADDFHPEENVEKMRAGVPLNDDDRLPWLQALGKLIDSNIEESKSIVLACSALKKSYRSIIAHESAAVHFVFLKGSEELIAARLAERKGHYMNPALLPSQFATLEVPDTEEAYHVDIQPEPHVIIESIVDFISTSN